MRLRADGLSPWGQRVWVDTHEFEALMDDLRRRAGVSHHIPGSGIDVDRVIERGLRTVADYCDLPPGVLGRTRFARDGSVRIEISRVLSDGAESDVVERRRLRSTLAHECGHVVCHQCLHVRDTETLSLFSDSESPAVDDRAAVMCRETTMHARYAGDWWEYQANQCMTALLLPKTLLAESVRAACVRGALRTFDDAIRCGRGALLLSELADEYDVSKTMMLYRLEALGFVPRGEQHRLQLTEVD